MTVELADIQAIVRLQLGLKIAKPNDHLIENLGADSADIVNIVVNLEEKYGIEIDESSLMDIGTIESLYLLVKQRAAEQS